MVIDDLLYNKEVILLCIYVGLSNYVVRFVVDRNILMCMRV